MRMGEEASEATEAEVDAAAEADAAFEVAVEPEVVAHPASVNAAIPAMKSAANCLFMHALLFFGTRVNLHYSKQMRETTAMQTEGADAETRPCGPLPGNALIAKSLRKSEGLQSATCMVE
jgi:hypothetical protein